MFLMIENPGVAPAETFTLIGAGLTDSSENSGVIGRFHSGAKYAITTLLRHGYQPKVYCGNETNLLFHTQPHTMSDGLSTKTFKKVCVEEKTKSNQNGKIRKLDWTLDMGKYDWTNIGMALREFISNALDMCLRKTGSHKDVVIEVVSDNQVRAKNGTTRIFIEYTPEVSQYHLELGQRYLHFSEPAALNNSILEKNDRNLENGIGPVIYKGGVFVRQIKTKLPSLFDYNLNDLELDECRNINDETVKIAISYALASASKEQQLQIIKTLLSKEQCFESQAIDNYSFRSKLTNDKAQEWKETWEIAAGKNAVLYGGMPGIDTFIIEKGYQPKTINYVWINILKACGIMSDEKLLSDTEKKGLQEVAIPPAITEAFQKIWTMLVKLQRTNQKMVPSLKAFKNIMQGGAVINGLCKDNTVWIEESLGGKKLLTVMLEEITHYITGAADNSRDIQNFSFQLAIDLAFPLSGNSL